MTLQIGKNASMGEIYGPAMEITEQKKADEYLSALVDYYLKWFPDAAREEAAVVQRGNLAYYAGYYDNETRIRVEGLFKGAHPVFGRIVHNGSPTAEEAFEMGKQWAEAAQKESEQG